LLVRNNAIDKSNEYFYELRLGSNKQQRSQDQRKSITLPKDEFDAGHVPGKHYVSTKNEHNTGDLFRKDDINQRFEKAKFNNVVKYQPEKVFDSNVLK
jgi:hypothetical protein